MTALAITPNWKNKTARFKGAVAAGEHVRVTIANDENVVTSTENLRLRVVGFDGRTLAQFPMPPSPDDDELSVESESGDVVLPLDAAPDTWDDDLTPLSCELNLNTVQMLEAVPRGASVPLTVVLEDFSAKTLYFKELCEFMSWPRKAGEEEPAPVNLDDYADRMADFDERLSAAEGDISSAVANANDAANRVTQALTEEGHFKDSAAASAAAAQNEKEAALSAKNAAVDAKNAASAAQTQAQLHAASAATAASNAAASAAAAAAALPLDDTLEDAGKAADAGAVGVAITAERTRAEAAEAALAADVQAEAQERVILSSTVQANANAVAALESGKADKSDTYTKAEVDTKIAGIHTFSKLVVTALPKAEAADDKTIYLVPRTGSETPDLCDEYVVVGAAGSRRWEKIGGGTVDLANYYTKAETNAALAGKASTADATLTPIYSDTPTFGEWTISPSGKFTEVIWSDASGEFEWLLSSDDYPIQTNNHDPNATSVSAEDIDETVYTATRVRTDILGYRLGSQTDKPLASVNPLLFAQYYPEGNVKSAAEFTPGIKYDDPDTTNRTITVKPFCNTGTAAEDNSNLSGRVVIPPFVDGDGNGYISDDGTRFKVVGMSNSGLAALNTNLTAIVAPNTVTTVGNAVFHNCSALTSVSLPAATDIGGAAFGTCSSLTSVSLPAATTVAGSAFRTCTSLATVSLPAATSISNYVFAGCTALTSVSLPAAETIGKYAFDSCTSLVSVDFGDTRRLSVPTLGSGAFSGVPPSCIIIVPDAQYDAWTAATIPDPEYEGDTISNPWHDLVTAGYKFLRHSEWGYARKYEVDKKADKPATFTTGNLAEFDANGNPVDSGIAKTAVAPLASPAFTGTPTAPTAAAGTNTTQVATTAFVQTAMSGIAAGDLLTIVTLADSTETMASILARLNAINAAHKHVFFDCSGIDVNPRLYLCTIMIDADANAVRVYDQVTGKLYIGPYDATETIGEVFAKAVDAYHSITVSAVTLDGVTVTGQTVTIREGTDATAPVYATATITDGAPVTFVVPKGMIYFLEITDTLADHFGPRVTSGARQGIATSDAAVTFTYYDAEHIDVSEITTFAKLQEALTWFGTNEAAARNNLVGIEIADTWTATNGTVYDNPRVVWDVHYFEDENGVSHLGALMGTKYCSHNDVQFDAAEGEECDSSTETVAEADVYYYGLASGETSKTAANLTLLELSTGDALPYADYAKIYKSAIRDTTRNSLQYGYNNWRDSAHRQYLNSDAAAGQWWGATHIGDVAPSQLNSVRGFMAGCSAALLAAAKKVKVATWPNYITDGSNQITTLYETLDTFFLPSGSEVYGDVNRSGGASVEGEPSPYWQARTGYDAPNNASTSTRIIYRELPVGSTASRSAAYVRLRSAARGHSSYVWLVSASGQVYNSTASSAYASVPACVIY